MQLLGFPPRAAVAIFAEVFHHQSHIFQMAHARLPVPKPETLRMAAHQGRRARAQLQRRRRGRRQLAEFIGFGRHAGQARERQERGQATLSQEHRWFPCPLAPEVRSGGSTRRRPPEFRPGRRSARWTGSAAPVPVWPALVIGNQGLLGKRSDRTADGGREREHGAMDSIRRIPFSIRPLSGGGLNFQRL